MSDPDLIKPLDKSKVNPQMARLIRNADQAWAAEALHERVVRSRNRRLGLILGAGVVGIYGYTLYSVKQEDFLQELDKKIVKASRPKDH